MQKQRNFWNLFYFRSGVCFFLIVVLFFTCILRISVISVSEYSAVQSSQNCLRLKISKPRGTIFDSNFLPITNNKTKIIAAISPTPRAITAISSILADDELESVLEKLKGKKPVLCEVPKEINCEGIVCIKVPETLYDNFPAAHLIGYTNVDGIGISGIESAYNDLLYFKDDISISYECDGLGRILEGSKPKVQNHSDVVASGVVTTLNLNIQNIAEKASDNLEMGAIVIADAKNGKIKAAVSRPNFEINNISKYLNAENSPLYNRFLNAYNVGSVFKPCVAIAGLESDKEKFTYNCTGSFEIIDRLFKCHKLEGHGYIELKTAIANSCNTFFYNYAFKIGAEKIYKKSTELNFGKPIKLCQNIDTAKGNLPSQSSLENIAHLANFSIGQGSLLLSPISMLTLYCAIASNGSYYLPSVIEGTLKNGNFNKYDIGNPTKVMTEDTAKYLRECLVKVLTDGTGISAQPSMVTAGGKTATAQTGKYMNGIEICQGWFCGFFPAENPEYVAIVFSEDTQKQTLTCSQIFAYLADAISAL